jgi:uncharacterized coiled-coil protein SlyX
MTEREGHEPAGDGALEAEAAEAQPTHESTRGHRGLLGGQRRETEAERLERALSDLGTAARKLVELQRGHEQMERRLVEVERAATQRGEALAQLREHLHAREAEIDRLQAEVGRARLRHRRSDDAAAPAPPTSEPVAGHLLFVPQGAGYLLEERPGPPPAPGETVVLSGSDGSSHFVVSKVGSSPLPADRRPCSYLLPTSPPTD